MPPKAIRSPVESSGSFETSWSASEWCIDGNTSCAGANSADMRHRRTAVSIAIFLLSLSLFATARPSSAAHPSHPCALIPKPRAASILSSRLTKVSERSGVVMNACTYFTAGGDGSPGIFIVNIWKIPLSDPQDGLGRVPGETPKPISGFGDSALIEENLNEMIFRVDGIWYSLVARGAPCHGDVIGASAEIKERCKRTRNAVMMAMARAIVSDTH